MPSLVRMTAWTCTWLALPGTMRMCPEPVETCRSTGPLTCKVRSKPPWAANAAPLTSSTAEHRKNRKLVFIPGASRTMLLATDGRGANSSTTLQAAGARFQQRHRAAISVDATLRAAAVHRASDVPRPAGIHVGLKIAADIGAPVAGNIDVEARIGRNLEANCAAAGVKVSAVAQFARAHFSFSLVVVDTQGPAQRHVLQHDAVFVGINFNSAGGVANLNGRLVGVDADIASNSGDVDLRLVAVNFDVRLPGHVHHQLHAAAPFIAIPEAAMVWIFHTNVEALGIGVEVHFHFAQPLVALIGGVALPDFLDFDTGLVGIGRFNANQALVILDENRAARLQGKIAPEVIFRGAGLRLRERHSEHRNDQAQNDSASWHLGSSISLLIPRCGVGRCFCAGRKAIAIRLSGPAPGPPGFRSWRHLKSPP